MGSKLRCGFPGEDVVERFYVLETGAYLRKSGRNLVIVKEGRTLAEVPLEGLTQLTLVGRSAMSGAVLDELIRRRIEAVLLSPEGRFRARLLMDEHKHVERRRLQYLRLSDPKAAAAIASSLVQAKLRNAARFLALRGKQHEVKELNETAAQIHALAGMLGATSDLQIIRGIEGRAANLYFSIFARLIRVPSFSFSSRNRRPPLDPVNALLSFAYTLLTNEVLTAIKTVGLDPYLGSLHTVEYGRPSLACDLVEEWRTFLGDRLVLTLINRQIVTPEDFVYRAVNHPDGVDEEALKANRPMEMKPKVLKAFLQAYERWMTSRVRCPLTGKTSDYRGLVRQQSRRFLRFLLGEAESYEAFPWSRIY